MKRTPVTDVIGFLTEPAWYTAVFWGLLVAAIAIAVWAWRALPAQRRPEPAAIALVRVLLGAMWWQQSLWKLPPYYTDDPTAPFGTTGLGFWMKQIVEFGPFELQRRLVDDVVLAHFYWFAPLVYAAELFIGVSLMLGVLSRLGALVGFLMAINLWSGLYVAPHEWPWTYFFLVLLQLSFPAHPPGRSLGLDALLRARPPAPAWLQRALQPAS
jgi:uncharacterized membrane protein YphA (DoxX/SURF4 family)